MTSHDLSEHHGPISELFEVASPGEALERYTLSEGQLEFYRENGYVAGVRIFTPEQCEALCEELDGLMDPNHPGNPLYYEFHSNESQDPETVLFHGLGAWRIGPRFHDMLWHPAFTVPASQLLGGPVRFWHDQLFCKPPRHGGVVAWHQDYSYWTRTKPMAHLTCWIGLDDSTTENGCLHYVPRTHEWPLLPVTGLTGDMNEITTVLDEEQKAAFEPIPIELERGTASFHHPLLIHGSFENRSERPRRATVINTCLDGVCSVSDEPLLQGVPVIPNGEKLDGRFFPLLYAGSDAP